MDRNGLTLSRICAGKAAGTVSPAKPRKEALRNLGLYRMRHKPSYAESRIMPHSAAMSSVKEPLMRHNPSFLQRFFRNASRRSPGRKSRARPFNGRVFARISSFSSRFASR